MAIRPFRKLSDRVQFILLHILGWLIYASYLLMLNSLGDNSFKLSYVIGYIIPFIAVFYASLFCLQFFNKKYGVLLGLTALVVMFCVICLAVYGYVYWVLPLFGLRLYLKETFNMTQFIQNILVYTVRFFVFALLYFFMQNYYRKKTLQAQSEAALLRAQIQPHFLYNALNIFYDRAQLLDKDLADNIYKLSRIMRYSLEQIEQNNETVPVSLELKQLQLLIDINQLRFSQGLQIRYEIHGDEDDQTIPPLALITIVENAFKHGDLKDFVTPLSIKVNLSAKQLDFSCSNKKRSKPADKGSTRIGMDNLIKRLEHSFKNRYTLTVHNELERYSVLLTINY